MEGFIATAGTSADKITLGSITWAGAATTTMDWSPLSGYNIYRAWNLPRRWRWTARGPLGSDGGDALSEAVAQSRARRAMERLRG